MSLRLISNDVLAVEVQSLDNRRHWAYVIALFERLQDRGLEPCLMTGEFLFIQPAPPGVMELGIPPMGVMNPTQAIGVFVPPIHFKTAIITAQFFATEKGRTVVKAQ